MSGHRLNGWATRPLAQVATLQRGFDLPTQERVPGPVPILAATSEVGSHSVAKVTGPGVVTGRSGSIGTVQYVERDFWPLNTTLYVKDFHGNHPRFIYYLLRHLRLERYHEGTGVPTLNRNNVHGVLVPVPPLHEQLRIAKVLDHSDAVRAKRRAAVAELDTLAQAMFVEMFGDPVTNPKGWPEQPLLDCADVSYGFPFDSKCFASDGERLVVRIRDVLRGWSDTYYVGSETFATAHWVRNGDIVVGMDGEFNCGRWRGGEALLNQRVCKFTASVGVLNDEYLFHCLGPILKRIESETPFVTVKHLSARQIKAIEVPLPPATLQREFAKRVAAVEKLKSAHHASLAELDALFASLQDRAFRGEL